MNATKTRTIIINAETRAKLLADGEAVIERAFRASADWRPHHYVNLTANENDPTPIGWGVCNRDGDEGYRCPWGSPGDELLVRDVYGRFTVEFCHVDGGRGRWKWVGLIKQKE